jgi:hypothetical protein
MLDQIPGHPWHVRWFPCEDVSVSPEEADECVFLFGSRPAPVNTKKWYGKGTDLWAELVTKYRSAGKISPEDSVKMPAVGKASSFGKRTVWAEFSEMRDDVAQKGRKGRMDG